MVSVTDPELVTAMRELKRRGVSSVEILRLLDRHRLTTVALMDHFQAAFGLDSYDVAPIGGWFADGSGELDDATVNAFLDDAITRRDFDAAGDVTA